MAVANVDSDDEFFAILEAYLHWEAARRPRTLRDRSNSLTDYDDVEFRGRFRLPKEAAVELLAHIEDQLIYIPQISLG